MRTSHKYTRTLLALLAFTLTGLALSLKMNPPLVTAQSQNNQSVQSSPPDLTPYARPVVPEDYLTHPPTPSTANTASAITSPTVVDVVVNNTDATLQMTDTFNDGEPTIAINPANPNEIVITAFSGSWGANAPLWHSTDGGNTWTKEFTVPVPPGVAGTAGCPCDQAVDYGRGNRLSGTFLSVSPTNVYSGTTTNPASSAAWNWFLSGGVAQRTNSAGVNNADQPWLLVNRDPIIAGQDNVYVAYDNFSGAPDMRVAVAAGTNPPNFTTDNLSGFSTGFVNPGHRLAVDPSNGAVYSLFQRRIAAGAGGSQNINFMLNRSTDGGVTWTLNGSPTGTVVANADSTQPTPKFGTVNALLGGVLHATVDPTNGDVYYVYGNRDSGTGNNRLAIRRLTDNGLGGLTIGPEVFITGQVQAALPSVAMTTNGVVGVLYDTFDGFSGGFPQFTAHFAVSNDHGLTFTDNVLETFLSSATDNGNSRQRVFGDYQQVKAVGNTFYGVFTGNGVPFGRTTSNHDPIFFKATALSGANVSGTKTASGNFTPGGTVTYTVTLTNGGTSTQGDNPGNEFTDVLPSQLTLVSASATSGTAVATIGTNTVTWNGSIPAAGSVTITITATIKAGVSGSVSNQGMISFDSNNDNVNDTAALTDDPGVGGSTDPTVITVIPFSVNITDPAVCTGPGNIVNVTAQVTNPNPTAQTLTFTATLPAQLPAVAGTCAANVAGTFTACSGTTVSWNGSLAAGQTVTITYQAQVADGTAPNTQLCISSTATIAAQTATVQACVTVNCPVVGPGTPPAAAIALSDQKPGSVLFYNIYTSNPSDLTRQNTRINITNTDPSRSIAVHLFFVDGASCTPADSFICLTPNQTQSFTAGDVDPGTTGYIIAVASDSVTGCPINFNFLIGDEFVKLSSGHAANLGAEAFAALTGTPPMCNAGAATATLNFDGVSYNQAPRVVAVDNFPSTADGNNTLLILNRVGGDLRNGTSNIGALFGVVYDEAEQPLSFTLSSNTCQFRFQLANSALRTAQRLETVISAGRTGWLRLWGVNDIGLLGSVINLNSNAGVNNFSQGHNLHKLTFTSASLIIPIIPPAC